MILKQIKDLIQVYNHGSQTFVEFVFQWTGHRTRSSPLDSFMKENHGSLKGLK
jgi:hypothetical protein